MFCISKRKHSTLLHVTTIVFVFALTTVALMNGTSPVYAADISTNAYISVSSNPIGINQTLKVIVWLVPSIPTSAVYHNYTVTFTKPDRVLVTIGPFDSEPGGFGTFNFTPDQNGTWHYKFSYSGGDIVSGNTYSVSTSPTSNLIVQTVPVPGLQPSYLPNSGEFSYWERPINAWNLDWYSFGGDWPQSGYNASMTYFNPYSTTPNSAHILWTQQTSVGGLVGGEYADASYSGGSSVTMIEAGLAYYLASDGMHCIDVHTGKQLWVQPSTSPTVGVPIQKYSNITGSSYEAGLLQVDDNFTIYDPFTGVATVTIPKALPGIYAAPYFYSYANGRLITWQPNFTTSSSTSFENLIVSNVTCNYNFSYIWHNIGVAINPWPKQSAAIDLTTGNTMWNMTIPADESPLGAVSIGEGKIFATGEGMVFRAYDINTGKLIWTSEQAQYPWGAFWSNYSAYAYGNLYGLSYDGHIYCFDAETGKINWSFYSGNSTVETPSSKWAFVANPVVADNKIYASTGYYTSSGSLPLGNKLYCINATTGKEIWEIYFAGGSKVVADSELLATNEYDGLLYCFGPGPTSVQVSVSPTIQSNGTNVVIQGYVLDQSPAQPNTPCISNQDMSGYMQFLHMQQPCPLTIRGVPVELRAITSSGSVIEIVKSTPPSDLYGHFSYLWNPPNPGNYTIVARYLGDDSYFPSYAATGLLVEQASPMASPTSSPTIAYSDTLVFAAVIVAIAAVLVSIIIGIYSIYDHRKLHK